MSRNVIAQRRISSLEWVKLYNDESSTWNRNLIGLQFRTSAPLPVGALLDLWVDISSRPGKFFLAGEVRWTRPGRPDADGNATWNIGVQLKSGAATDILHWRDYHAAASSS